MFAAIFADFQLIITLSYAIFFISSLFAIFSPLRAEDASRRHGAADAAAIIFAISFMPYAAA